MKKLNKENIEKLIKEILQERFADTLANTLGIELPIFGNNPRYKLYNNFDEWMRDNVDDEGFYIGPNIPGSYQFISGKQLYVADEYGEYKRNAIDMLEEWNKEIGKKIRANDREIFDANRQAHEMFIDKYPEAILGKLIPEGVEKNQQFQIGDLVKLRPDILNKVHQGPNHESREWRKTIEQLQDKMGKIIKIEPGVSTVSVEYEDPWVNTDEHGRKSKVNKIGIQSYLLVPYSEDPSLETEGFGGGTTKDINADPKHIPGERWRIKYSSSKDLKKHGDTEMSSVKELRDLGHMPDSISVKKIREVVQELIKEMWIGFEEEGDEKVHEGEKTQNITINIVDKIKKKIKETMDNPNK